jgi:phage recombination protein Bet
MAATHDTALQITYTSQDGQEIKLTPEIIRSFLVHGKAELVTTQELAYFMGICKARALNPFAKDCYLIKYGNDPAAIVTSIDYFRKLAREQADCRGWHKGIVVQDAAGNVRKTSGLLLETETLIGGWFSAKPAGWDEPFELEVNLKGYIKKTKDGVITRFWQDENQATMIAKVAEGQGLRAVWPKPLGHFYTNDEILPDTDSTQSCQKNIQPECTVDNFWERVPAEYTESKVLWDYITLCAKHAKKDRTEIMIGAVKDFDTNFWPAFLKHIQNKGNKPPQESQASPPQEHSNVEQPGFPSPDALVEELKNLRVGATYITLQNWAQMESEACYKHLVSLANNMPKGLIKAVGEARGINDIKVNIDENKLRDLAFLFMAIDDIANKETGKNFIDCNKDERINTLAQLKNICNIIKDVG